MGAGSKISGSRVESMARRHCDQRLITLGNISLHMIELLHVFGNTCVVVLLFQVDQCSEVRSVRPVFTFLCANINGVALVVIIHGIDTAGDVFNHHISEGVKAMFAIHFHDAKIAIHLTIEVKNALDLFIALVLVAVLQSLGGDGPVRVNERSLLVDKGSSACLFKHL